MLDLHHIMIYSRGVARVNQQPSTQIAAEIAAVADFRYALRMFLRRTVDASNANGLTPQRYDLLLQIKNASGGEATVSELTERLVLPQPAVTELVKRAELAGLVRRRRDSEDGRVSRIGITAEGERRLLATFVELRADRSVLVAALMRAGRRFRAAAAAHASHL